MQVTYMQFNIQAVFRRCQPWRCMLVWFYYMQLSLFALAREAQIRNPCRSLVETCFARNLPKASCSDSLRVFAENDFAVHAFGHKLRVTIFTICEFIHLPVGIEGLEVSIVLDLKCELRTVADAQEFANVAVTIRSHCYIQEQNKSRLSREPLGMFAEGMAR